MATDEVSDIGAEVACDFKDEALFEHGFLDHVGAALVLSEHARDRINCNGVVCGDDEIAAETAVELGVAEVYWDRIHPAEGLVVATLEILEIAMVKDTWRLGAVSA